MKQVLKVISVLVFFLLYFSIFSCKAETETEYITKTETEYVEKKYAEAVIFTAEDVASAGVKVTMSTATKGAKIYYTTDGIEPTEKSVLYSSPVNFTKDVTVKAVAIKSGMENSPVAVATVSMTEKTVTVEVEKEPDTTPPGKVILTENSVIAGNGKVLLSWQNPGNEDFYGTRVLFTPAAQDVTQPLVIKGEKSGNSSILINGLENETEYTFSLIALDKNQNESEAVTIKAIPVTPPDTSDKIAPGEVLNLSATPFNKRVKLEWNDPSDEDLFGIEVSWTEVSDGSRAISAMDEKSLFVAPGMGCIEIPVLENDIEYQFSVKTMDISGNKSAGVVINSTPIKEALKIELRAPEEKSKSNITVTANITTGAQDVIKVVYKKDGSKIATELLSDSDAVEMTKRKYDYNSKEWFFLINATDESYNGTYTVTAIDSDGRSETAQIKIDNFDFTPPEKIKLVSKIHEWDEDRLDLSWTNPNDEDFDHVEISYTVYGGNKDIGLSAPEIVRDNKKSFDVSDVKFTYYTYYIVSVDKSGNKSEPVSFKVALDKFKKVPGVSISGTETWTPESKVFINGRKIEIDSFYMSDHEVTREEYKEIIGSDPSSCMALDADGFEIVGELARDHPVDYVNWYDAIVYCNKRSMAEGLTPCYEVLSKDKKKRTKDPEKWGQVPDKEDDFFYYNWKFVTCDFTANGYRLPTEAEWEWAARGGENFIYAGSDNFDDVGVSGVLYIPGRYDDVPNYVTKSVKTKKANGYGLYDMSGNVKEWCWDWCLSFNNGIMEIAKNTPATGRDSGDRRSLKSDAVWGRGYAAPYERMKTGIGFRLVRSSL